MKMSWKFDSDLWATIFAWVRVNWPTIYGAALAVITAYARLTYDGNASKSKLIEAALCGALSLTITGALDYMGLSPSLAPFAGGMIGFIGVDKLRQVVIKVLDKKADGA